MSIVSNPIIPFLGSIDGGFVPGKLIRIQGQTALQAERFNVNLQCGPSVTPRDNIALHIAIHLDVKCVVRNSLENQQWGQQEDFGSMPLAPGQQFELLILCEPHEFKIAVNGQHYCEFKPRFFDSRGIGFLTIDGDVTITLISYEIVGGSGQLQQPQYLPQPQMNPMQQPQTHPNHPQSKNGSGFDGFLSQAGTAIAGALATGGVLNALSNRNTSGSSGLLNSLIGGGGFGGGGIGSGYPFPNFNSHDGISGRRTDPGASIGSLLTGSLADSLLSGLKRH